MKYEIIIYWSNADEAFIAEVPELPGCMADGSTKAKALKAVEKIAEERIETAKELGRNIPEPKGRLIFAGESRSAGIATRLRYRYSPLEVDDSEYGSQLKVA